MQLTLDISGDVVERSELLNGTLTVTIAGETPDGAWSLAGSISWSRGLIDYPGEGDITLTCAGGQIFGTVQRAQIHPDPDDERQRERLALTCEVDGGDGAYDGAAGDAEASLLIEAGTFAGRWMLRLDSD